MASRWRLSLSLSAPMFVALEVRKYATAWTTSPERFFMPCPDLADCRVLHSPEYRTRQTANPRQGMRNRAGETPTVGSYSEAAPTPIISPLGPAYAPEPACRARG